MKTTLLILAAACFASLSLGDVLCGQAQDRQASDHSAGAMFSLLRMESVRKELELEPEQIKKIELLQTEMWEGTQDKMEGLGFLLEPAERREQFEAFRQKIAGQRKKYIARLKAVLLPLQWKRLKELQIQSVARRRGDGAVGILKSKIVLNQLGVNEEQSQKLKTLSEEVRKEMEAEIKKLQQRAEEKLLSVLTEQQREAYYGMVGESFSFEDQNQRKANSEMRGKPLKPKR